MSNAANPSASGKRDERTEGSLDCERQKNQQQAVQRVHRDASAALHRIRIVGPIHKGFGESALVGFVAELPQRFHVKAGGGDKAADPQFYERGMLWIDAKVAIFYIGNPSGYVVCLVDGEAVQTRSDGGAKDAKTDKKQH